MKRKLKSLMLSFVLAVVSVTVFTTKNTVMAYSNDAEESIVYTQEEMDELEAQIREENSMVRKGKSGFTVVIDAGHGGYDSGAVNSSKNITEKFLNLSLAKYTKERLESRGINVIMTRTTDKYISLKQRSAIANAADADMFVSLHNDYGSSKSNGAHVIYSYSDRNGMSKQLANNIIKYIDTKTEQNKRSTNPVWTRTSNGHDYYSVLRHTEMPSVIIEHSYMNNSDINAVYTDAKRKKMGTVVADAIYDTMKYNYKGLVRVKGKYKYYDENKNAMTGCWVKDGKDTKYLRRNGYLAKGWLNIKGEIYYFDSANRMVTGNKKINNKNYTFRNDGRLVGSI